jgi:putative component of membrane protein insertase Oxa1/YidC/SpoIIIJ protein YidD
VNFRCRRLCRTVLNSPSANRSFALALQSPAMRINVANRKGHPMRMLALAAITLYRRWISPFKGFSCAHRVYLGGESCSDYGFRVFRDEGFRTGLSLLGRRLHACSAVHRAHSRKSPRRAGGPSNEYQTGFCDISCDGCDLGSGADMLSGCDACSCDLPSWRKKKSDDGTWV